MVLLRIIGMPKGASSLAEFRRAIMQAISFVCADTVLVIFVADMEPVDRCEYLVLRWEVPDPHPKTLRDLATELESALYHTLKSYCDTNRSLFCPKVCFSHRVSIDTMRPQVSISFG